MIKLNNRGQGLIEALVALGVSSIIVAAIAMAVVTSLDNASFSKYQNLATHYAQQGMDIMRQKSETNWADFEGLCSTGNCNYCLAQSSDILIGGTCNIANITNDTVGFVRKVTIDSGSGCSSGKKVTVTVSWSDGKCKDASNIFCHSVVLDSCIAQINDAQTP